MSVVFRSSRKSKMPNRLLRSCNHGREGIAGEYITRHSAVIAPFIAEYANLYPESRSTSLQRAGCLIFVVQGYDLAIWYAAASDPALIVRSARVLSSSDLRVTRLSRQARPTAAPVRFCTPQLPDLYDAPTAKTARDWIFTGLDGDFPSASVQGLDLGNKQISPILERDGAALAWLRVSLVGYDDGC